MREKLWTKGPWIVHSHEADECCIEQDNDDPLQVCGLRPLESCASEDYISPRERSANADLISASPDMFDALQHQCLNCEFKLTLHNSLNGTDKKPDCKECVIGRALGKACGE